MPPDPAERPRYRESGLQGLRPQPRSDQGLVRKQPELLEEACRLRREAPTRSAQQISRILLARHQVRVSLRTISAHLQRRGLDRGTLRAQPRVFGRFEAERPNEVWMGDVLHGPFISHPRRSGSRSPYTNAALERICAVLGIRLIHSQPGQPAGRGKVERAFRFVREAFLSEATLQTIESFQQPQRPLHRLGRARVQHPSPC